MNKLINSNGISVQFPFVPYPVQVDYINKVTKALKESTNAVLESPTGTGKTLCLLCATLAWQNVHKRSAKKTTKQNLEYNEGPLKPLGSETAPAPVSTQSLPSVILYASRTHSQLSQVVSELKNTGYAPRMTVLGSREQLCIQSTFVNLKGGSLTRACNMLTDTHRCMYKNNLEHFSGRAEGVGDRPSPILDIEEIRNMGIRDSVCPYFYSRDNIEDADLILLPYNYLVDPSIRSTLNVDWRNSVVIFDEAHNLEFVASDASSFSISSIDIAACIKEMQDAIRTVQELKQTEAPAEKPSKAPKGPSDESKGRPNIDRCLHILRGLFQLESRIDSVTLATIPNMNKVGKVCQGAWLLELFEGCGFSIEMALSNIQQLQLCSEMFVYNAETLAGGDGGRSPESKLDYLSKVFIRLFRGKSRQECIANTQFYRVFITDEVVEATSRRLSGGGGGVGADHHRKTLSGSLSGTKKRVINYWCFSSGLALEDLRKLGVRSFILTSGTLSPMDSFKEDARIPFSEQLENEHVIQNKQIWIGTVTHGPNGVELNSSFANRQNAAYQDDLGNSILTFCQAMIGRNATTSGVSVPTGPELRGGVLVFFPSYSLLDSIKKRWQETSIWDKLSAAMGSIVVESKNGSASAPTRRVATQRDFYDTSASSEHPNPSSKGKSASYEPGGGGEASAYEMFENAVQANGGRCLLLAVCRGKMSEGIDFRDEKGRVVIITGIPYSPPVDPWVVLKRQFMDDNGRIPVPPNSSALTTAQAFTAGSSVLVYPPPKQHAAPVTPSVRRVTGQEWYEQSAIRAVNQAVGRVIRHKNDWGAIVMMDSRFQQGAKINQLSKWLRPRIKTYQQILPALGDFRAFVTAALKDPSLQRAPKDLAPTNDSAASIAPYIPKGATFSASLEGVEDSSTNVKRQVVVFAEALGLNEDKAVDYVNPELLSTQNQSRGRAFEMDTDDALGLRHGFPQSQFAGFEEFMSQLNSQSERDNSLMLNSVPQRTKEKKIPSLNEIFGQDTKATKPVAVERVPATVQDKSNRPLNLFAKTSSILQRDKLSNYPHDITSSQKFGLSATTEVSSDSGIMNSESSGMFLKSLADHLRGKLPQSACDDFTRELRQAVGRSRMIEQLKEIRHFVDRIHTILSAHLGQQAVLDVLTRLTPLIAEKHRGIYASITKNLCSQPNKRTYGEKIISVDHRSVDKSAHKDTSATETEDHADIEQEIEILSSQIHLEKRKVETVEKATRKGPSAVSGINALFNKVVSDRINASDTLSDSVTGNSSKRARMMALQESPMPNKTTKKSIQEMLPPNVANSAPNVKSPDFLAKISQLTLPRPQGRSDIEESTTNRQRLCVVCNELSSELQAARCGHVSCMRCWKSWTAHKQTCPQCRAPVKLAELTNIVIK